VTGSDPRGDPPRLKDDHVSDYARLATDSSEVHRESGGLPRSRFRDDDEVAFSDP
jgi:hypothetical protein